MAADSDGDLIETVLTCEGDLKDPAFAQKFDRIVTRLRKLVCTGEGESLRVAKVEPWNSVRVTFTIPREAALRLRQLAQEGNAALTALGILSVQVEGDQVISLRIAGPCGSEPREIVLRTSSAGADNAVASTSSAPDPVALPAAPPQVPVGAHPPQFRSPNVVAPTDGDPIPPIPPAASPGAAPAACATPGAGAGPFPFASMTHAAHAMRERPAVTGSPTYRAMQAYTTTATSSPAPPPPPYPSSPAPISNATPPSLSYPSKPVGGRPDVALSSPLLVNLLQNDAGGSGTTAGTKMPPPPPGASEKPVRARPANKKAVVRRRPDGTVLSESPGKVPSAFANVPQSEEVLSRLSPSSNFPSTPDLPSVSFGPRQPTAGPRHAPSPAQATPGRQYPGPGPQPPPYSNRLPNQQQMLLQQQQLQQQRLLQQRMLQHQAQQQMGMTEAKPYTMAPNVLAPNAIAPNAIAPNAITPNAIAPTNAAPSSDFSRYPANGNGTTTQWARGPAPFPTTAPQPPTPAPSYAPEPAASPPPLTSAGKRRQLLINPLTGHLEPMASESSSDSEPEAPAAAPEAGTPDDPFFYFPSPLNDRSNSMFSDDDDDVSSTMSRRADTTTTTDQSDSEATVRSTASEASSSRGHHRKRDRSPAAGGEKIKLRLKLDKGEPTPAAYKVDVSFAAARKGPRPEEPRVPPLHISLRGRAAVVVSSRKKYVPTKDGPASPTAKKRAPVQGVDGQPVKTKGSKSSANSTPRPRKPGAASGKAKSGEPRTKPRPDVAAPVPPVDDGVPVKEERKLSPSKAKRRDAKKRTAEGPQREQNLLSGGRMLDSPFRGSGRGGHSKGGGHAGARRREVVRRGSEGEVKVEENGVGAGDKRRRQSCPDDKDLSFTDTQGVPSAPAKQTAPPVSAVPSATPRAHNAHAKPGNKAKHPGGGTIAKPHREENCVKRNDSSQHEVKRNCDADPARKVQEDVVKVSDSSSKRVLDVLDAISKQQLEPIEVCKQRLLAARAATATVKQRHMEVAEINALGLDVTVTEVTPKGRSGEETSAKKRLADAGAVKQRIEIVEVNAKSKADVSDAYKHRLLEAKRPGNAVETNAKPKAPDVSEVVKHRLMESTEVSAKRIAEIAEANAKQRMMEASEANAKQRLHDVVEVSIKQRILDAAETNAKRSLEVSDVNSKKRLQESTDTKQRLMDGAESKQRLMDVSETKQRLMDATETKQRLIDVAESKQRLMNAAETKQRLIDVAESKQRLMDVVETKQRLMGIAETNRRLMDLAETKQRLLDVSDSKQRILEVVDTKPQIPDVADSKQKLLDVADPKQRIPDVSETKQRILDIGDSKQRLPEVTDSKQRILEIADSKQRILDVVDTKQRILDVDSKPRLPDVTESKQRILDIAESKQRLLDVTESKQRLLDVTESKQRLLDVTESKQRLLDVTESKQRLLDVAESKQRLLDVTESKQRLLDVTESKQRLLDVTESKQRLLDVTESKQRLLEVADSKQRLLEVAETDQRLTAVEEANAKQRLLESSVSKRLVEETALKQRGSPESKEANGEAGNTQGEDSGIESMDALSEKSPNQGESPGRKDDTPPAAPALPGDTVRREENESKPPELVESSRTEVVAAKAEPDDIAPAKTDVPDATGDEDRDCESPPLVVNRSTKAKPLPASASSSPSPDDPQPIRITPPLYTYSNPEKHRDETPSPGVLLLDDEEDGRTARRKEEMRRKRKRKQELEGRTEPGEDAEEGARFLDALADKAVSKSLLEQLLIEIPADEGKRGRSTRSSSLKTPRSSPLVRDDNGSKLSPLVRSKRKRQESESSAASSLAPDCIEATTVTATTGANAAPRPGKRKCSENAAELIKACMGLDESPAKKAVVAPTVAPATSGVTGTANAVVDGRRVAGKTRKAGACPTLTEADSSEDDEPLIDLKSRPTPVPTTEDTTPRHRTPRVSVPTAKMAAALGKESTPRRSGRQAPRTPLTTPKTRAKPAHPATPVAAVAQVAAAVAAPTAPVVGADEEGNRRKTRSAGPSVETEGVNKSTRRRPSRDGK